ncbi:MAG: hypothetical protein ACRDFW_10130 [bacterium]
MLKSVEGVYRDGKIELTEFPGDVRNETRVIVTFLEMGHIGLRARGIDEAQAAELRAQLGTFAEEWNSPDMGAWLTGRCRHPSDDIAHHGGGLHRAQAQCIELLYKAELGHGPKAHMFHPHRSGANQL